MNLRILSAVILLSIAGCSKSPEDKVKDLLQTAQKHLEKFEYDKAQQAFSQAAVESKVFSYDKYGQSRIFEQQLYYYEALNGYLNLALVFPDSPSVHAGVYRQYSRLGHTGRALEAATKYFELSPRSEEAALTKIRALIAGGKYFEARQEIESSTGKPLDNSTADALKAMVFLHLNEFDSSSLFLEQALTVSPVSSNHYFICAEVLEATGYSDSAMTLVRKAAGSDTAPVEDLYLYFDRALANNYYGDARKIIRLLEQRGAGKEITLALNVLLAKDQNNFTRSRIINADFLVTTPRNVSTIMFDLTSGGSRYNDPLTIMSLSQSATQYMEDMNYNPELKMFAKTKIELFKGSTEDLVSAWHGLQQINSPIANTREVTLMEAYLLYRTGQFEPGLKKLRQLHAANVSSPVWLTGLADIYAHPSVHIFDTALKIYDEALNADMFYKDAFVHKVKTLRYLGHYQKALAEFDKHPQFERHYQDMAVLKAICLAENNIFEMSFEIFSNQGKSLKGNLEPFRELVSILERKYHDKEISQMAELCGAWAQGNVDILMFAARLQADQKNYSKALELSDEALALEPGIFEARVQQARALYNLGKRTEALELFEALEREDAGDGDVNYYFSQILAKEKIDHDHSTNMARSALRAFHSDEKAFINLCQVYAAYGDHKFAYGDAQKGLSEFPQSASLWYQLGLAAHQLGRANTEENLKKAIEFGLDGEDLKKAKEILATL